MWKQHFRVNWMKKGNFNMRFFHTKASNYRRRNHLTSQQNAKGFSLKGDLLANHIVNYFQDLFSANTAKGPMDSLLDMGPRISQAMREDISCAFTNEKVHIALKQMHQGSCS